MTDISRKEEHGRPAVLDGVVNRALIEGLVAALDAAEAERDKLRAILWARIRGENECVTECVYPEGGQCGCHEEMQALLAQQEPPRD